MLRRINLSNKNFSFFKTGSTNVETLEAGAELYGGATKFGDKIISNIDNGEFVEVSNNNTLRVFVPSTTNVNGLATMDIIRQNLDLVTNTLKSIYLADESGSNLQITPSQGSWFSEDNNCVVVEEIYIVSIDVKEVTELDIQIFYKLAERIKHNMGQEGVSIMINQALAIV